MNIYPNYSVMNCGYNKKSDNLNKNVSFGDYMGHKDTERTAWGTTWGEERVMKEHAEAEKRMIQRETLRKSDDPFVRQEAENVGKNPVWDAYLTQREFDKYHERVMAQREAEAAELRAAAGIKNYDSAGKYTICDEKGRVVERGTGDEWESRYQYDINYPVNRFGEYYTMRGAVKETRSDDTYVIRVSPHSDSVLEEKFKNQSIEYVDNCTHMVKSVKLPDGSKFSIPMRLLKVNQTENSRQYFSQYDLDNVALEVFEDGSYKRA